MASVEKDTGGYAGCFMKQKIISLLLGMTMILSGFSFSFAADETADTPVTSGTETGSTLAEQSSASDEIAGDQTSDGKENMDADTGDSKVTGNQSTDGTEAVDSDTGEGSGKEELNQNSEEEEPVVRIVFNDVQDSSSYYYHPVYWAVKNKITQGTSSDQFSPDASCTRAQIVTFLWRKAGEPEPSAESNPFKDVSDSDYFYKAVLWAVNSGITSGTTEDTFSPDNICTRAQCATFLWRGNGSPAPQIGGAFSDVNAAAYYSRAVGWALENGVTSGTSATQFSPDASCTRGQTVTFFYRASLQRVDRNELKDGSVSGSFTEPAVNQSTGLVQLRAEDAAADAGVQSVRAAVWTKDSQNDLHWYEMKSLNDGILEATWNVQDYNRTFGTYHAKLYIVTDSAQMVLMDQKSFDVKAHGYLYTEALGDRRIKVTVLGIPEGDTASFASWSDENYLDDLFWTDAENQGNGTWSAVLDTTKFASEGICNTDVYVNGNEVLNTTKYSVSLWDTMTDIEWQIYESTEAVYAEVGRDLYACFRYSAGIPYYRSTPDPQSGYTNSQWYALYGFKHYRGHCYVHAATFYWLAKNLGYEAYYLQGYVPRKGGGVVTHGWVEIVMNGTTYVFDPNFTNETGRNGYKITYGTSGTWRYQSYRRMS